jgi:hypothetical protein
MNIFKKEDKKEEKKEDSKKEEKKELKEDEKIDEFIKNSTIEKIDSNPEVSAYFLAEEEMKERKVAVESIKLVESIPIQQRYEKFIEKLKHWT